MQNSQLSIIFQTKDGVETDFEFQYLNELLFSKLNRTIYLDNGRLEIKQPNAIVIYSNDKLKIEDSFINYIKEIKKDGLILFHLSNESQNHYTNYYKYASLVFKTANWNPFSVQRNVYTLPLGFQSGYLNLHPEEIQLDRKKLVWCFAGAVKQDRQLMLDAFEEIGPSWYYKSSDWGASDQKNTEELIEIYQDSIFALSPMGNINFECFRTMESLEWGCIPIVTEFLGEDCYKYIYGNHPFVIGKDWNDAAQKVQNLLRNPQLLLEKQLDVWNWYQNFKKELQTDIFNIIIGNNEAVKGFQFKYQQESKKNIVLKWNFLKHFTLKVYWRRFIGKAKVSTSK